MKREFRAHVDSLIECTLGNFDGVTVSSIERREIRKEIKVRFIYNRLKNETLTGAFDWDSVLVGTLQC